MFAHLSNDVTFQKHLKCLIGLGPAIYVSRIVFIINNNILEIKVNQVYCEIQNIRMVRSYWHSIFFHI